MAEIPTTITFRLDDEQIDGIARKIVRRVRKVRWHYWWSGYCASLGLDRLVDARWGWALILLSGAVLHWRLAVKP